MLIQLTICVSTDLLRSWKRNAFYLIQSNTYHLRNGLLKHSDNKPEKYQHLNSLFGKWAGHYENRQHPRWLETRQVWIDRVHPQVIRQPALDLYHALSNSTLTSKKRRSSSWSRPTKSSTRMSSAMWIKSMSWIRVRRKWSIIYQVNRTLQVSTFFSFSSCVLWLFLIRSGQHSNHPIADRSERPF